MKIHEIKSFSFSELSDDAKEVAISKNYDWNVQDSHWHESEVEDIKETIKLLCGSLPDNVYFSVDRGSYVSFDANMYYLDVLNALKNSNGHSVLEAIKDEFLNELESIDSRVLKLVENDLVQMVCVCEHGNGNSSFSWEYEITGSYQCSISNIEEECERIAEILEDICNELESIFLKQLRGNYEYLTSEAGIKESFEANDTQFLETGEVYQY